MRKIEIYRKEQGITHKDLMNAGITAPTWVAFVKGTKKTNLAIVLKIQKFFNLDDKKFRQLLEHIKL